MESVHLTDLFAGCGALTLGAFEAARAIGVRPSLSLAADVDEAPLNVLSASLGVAKDAVRTVDLEMSLDGILGSAATDRERAFLDLFRSPQIVLAGPPCQGHSSLNNHTRHNDERNDLYLRVVRFVELTRPRFCLIENVITVRRDQRRSVRRAIDHLGSLGYNVDDGIVSLDRLGVPQSRRRHVLVACAPDEPVLKVDVVVARHALAGPARTVNWAIGDLADRAPLLPFDAPARQSPDNQVRIALLDEHGWDDLPNEYRPDCHRLPKKRPDGTLRKHTYKSMYGRLRWDLPAQTITSGYGSMGQGRYVHPSRLRTLTPHEAARLQFFPDFYRFDIAAKRTRWAAMIGNAAPMKLSFAFVLEMLR